MVPLARPGVLTRTNVAVAAEHFCHLHSGIKLLFVNEFNYANRATCFNFDAVIGAVNEFRPELVILNFRTASGSPVGCSIVREWLRNDSICTIVE